MSWPRWGITTRCITLIILFVYGEPCADTLGLADISFDVDQSAIRSRVDKDKLGFNSKFIGTTVFRKTSPIYGKTTLVCCEIGNPLWSTIPNACDAFPNWEERANPRKVPQVSHDSRKTSGNGMSGNRKPNDRSDSHETVKIASNYQLGSGDESDSTK